MNERDGYGLWILPRLPKLYAAAAIATVVSILALNFAFGSPTAWTLPHLPASVSVHPSIPQPPSTYASTVLSDHPQAYWQLSDLSGADSSPHHLNLTSIVGATLDQVGPIPNHPAIAFGPNGYASASPGPILGAGTSLEFWAKNSDRSTLHVVATDISGLVNGTSRASLLAFASPDFLIDGYAPPYNGLQAFDLYRTAGILTADDINQAFHWWQGWHHFVVTFSITGIRLYEDTVLLGVGTPALDVGYSPGLFVLANNSNHSSPFAGSLAQVAVYNQVLSPAQINIHYAASTAGFSIDPANLHVAIGRTAYFYPHSFTLAGADISQSDTYTVLSVGIANGSGDPAAAICVPTRVSNAALIACKGLSPGLYYVQVRNASGQIGASELWVDPPATTFSISPAAFSVKINTPALFSSSAFSADARDVSLSDSFSVYPPPGVECSPAFQRSLDWAITCQADTVDTYVLQFVDDFGHPASTRLLVSAP